MRQDQTGNHHRRQSIFDTQAYALAILGAEYIACLLPRGTHDWSQFITPSAPPAPWLRRVVCCSHCQLPAVVWGQPAKMAVRRSREHVQSLAALARG
jgi:hypothetical protein